MAGRGQGSSRRPPSMSNLNASQLHQKSWGSDDWQRLLSTHFGGAEEGAPQSDPLFRLTSDGTMLSELLSTLETGDPNGAADPTAPLFSEDTINAILGERLRETAAQVALELGQQQHQQPSTSAPAPAQQQQAAAGVDLQTVLSGHSTSSMMSLQEATAAMQTQNTQQHPTQTLPLPGSISQIHHQQQQQQQLQQQFAQLHPQQQGYQQQQYVTLLDGRVLQQADGSAVLASVPSGQQPLAVALPGSTSVLQYIPVLNSQVVTVPHIQVQVQPTSAQQQQQLAALAAATLSGGAGGALSDGSGAVLPTTSSTPPATTPTSAAAATAAVYTSEISTTQQLVATAAAQQQWLQQEAAANAACVDATNAANVAMREATAAMVHVANQSGNTNGIATSGHVSPTTLSMPPPPPRAPRLQQPSADAAAMLQPPSLTPQLRPATSEPFPNSLASAVLAAAQASAGGSGAGGGTHQQDYINQQDAALLGVSDFQAQGTHAPTPLLRPAASSAETPVDGQLPRKPSHKRERSLRSASPALADPSTAPTIKYAKGHNDGVDDDSGGGTGNGTAFGTSPDSCILAANIAVSVGGSSGDVSPLQAVYRQAMAMPEPPLAPQLLQQPQVPQQQQREQVPQQPQQQQPTTSGPGSTTTTTDANNSAGAGNAAAAAGTFEVDDDVVALMQAALAPKHGKRRGRPPGSKTVSAPTAPDEPRELTEAEILEIVLREDPSRCHLPVDEIKKLIRKERNRIAAALSRARTQNYTAALESRVRALQAEQAELAGWLQAPPQGLPHRVLLVGPAAAAGAGAAVDAASGQPGRPPIRHLSL